MVTVIEFGSGNIMRLMISEPNIAFNPDAALTRSAG